MAQTGTHRTRAHWGGEVPRGRDARSPTQIPMAGWRDVLVRTWRQANDYRVSMTAASIAFFGLLALFPAIAAFVAIGGLLIEPAQIQEQLDVLRRMLPAEAAGIVLGQVRAVAATSGGGVALAAAAGLLFTLYSASRAMKALIEGLNFIYRENETRGFLRLNLTAFLLTLGLMLTMILAIAVIAVVPAVLATIGLGSVAEWTLFLARWPLLFAVSMLGLAIVYRFAPCRNRPRWQWVSWGALLATTLWVIGSIAFSIYVRQFGSYNETYGSLGAVIILLVWFWLSSYMVLLGAALNAELEHQTARDSTLGEPKPMGERGAHMADTLGEATGGGRDSGREPQPVSRGTPQRVPRRDAPGTRGTPGAGPTRRGARG